LNNTALGGSTWYAVITEGKVHYTTAGYWLAFVSLPFFQFLLLQWCWRIVLWYQFLWRRCRVPRPMNFSHPDKGCRHGILEGTPTPFAPLLIANSAVLAAAIGNRILHAGARLTDFKFEIGVAVSLQVALVLIPLIFYIPKLEAAKRRAGREFGVLASS